ncbi:epi-neemfruitin B 7-O-acetyltransferse L7AT-like [Coffea arabica]|uniref:Epi-neemfruitin B 7-O-acetyltransferse L7AT-like n=1 Tax=Coffea arabica TaxID=13443 RepID=A0ABM4VH76_COFAR
MYVVPLVYFFKNDGKSDISKRRELLKQSLSETLVHFYPLAGKVKDNLHVDCNDDGMYYVEARVNAQLSDFLGHPQQKLIHGLLPFHPSSTELFTKTYVAMVQVNIFECGGIAIGIYSSHKVMDGQSTVTFMNAWAATARGSSESFISSSIFHPNPKLPKDTSILIPPPQSEQSKSATRRFVFDASALNALKNNATCAESNVTNPSRVTAAMGLTWQCAIATSQARFGFRKPSILTFVVNLRSRNSPPLPPYSMGNIFWVTYAKCLVNSDLKLPSMVRRVRNGIDKLDNSFLEDIKGKDGSLVNVMKHLKELEEVHTGNLDTEYLSLSSICNGGIYNADFGWGKPIWTCIGSAGIDALGLPNLVVFMDTRSGDGIEAWVTLKENDMAIFEKIPELLNFATLDPSPLEISLSA